MMTKVLLRDRKSRRYYAGPGRWVTESNLATDFVEIRYAAKAFAEEDLLDAEIIIDNGELPTVEPKATASKHRPPTHRRPHS